MAVACWISSYKRAVGLKSGKMSVNKCFFRVIRLQSLFAFRIEILKSIPEHIKKAIPVDCFKTKRKTFFKKFFPVSFGFPVSFFLIVVRRIETEKYDL